MTSISPKLIAYYDATDYTVHLPGAPFTVHIGEHSEALAKLHAHYGVSSSAMITGFNPYSRPRSEAENRAANQALSADLAAQSFQTIPAEGTDPTGQCAPEPGFFIPGISYDAAFALARKYQQNAFVFADESAIPRLGLCE